MGSFFSHDKSLADWEATQSYDKYYNPKTHWSHDRRGKGSNVHWTHVADGDSPPASMNHAHG